MSLGYIPSVERLRLPARRRHPWVLAPWADSASDKTAAVRPVRRGLILDLDDTLYPRERFVRSGFAAVARHVAAAHGVPADAAMHVALASSMASIVLTAASSARAHHRHGSVLWPTVAWMRPMIST